MTTSFTPYKGITVTFDESKHQFLIGDHKIDSVTSITKVIDKSAKLMGWQERITKDYLLERLGYGQITREEIITATALHRTKKKEAGSVGDAIHEFAQLWSMGLKPPFPEEQKAANGALAFLKWIDQEKFKISNPEELLYSRKYNFAGIKDSDIKRNKELFVCDYKTGKEIYPEYRIQTSAYLFAAKEMCKRNYKGYWILKFGKEDGNFEPLYVPLKEAKKDFEAFLSAFALTRRLQEIK